MPIQRVVIRSDTLSAVFAISDSAHCAVQDPPSSLPSSIGRWKHTSVSVFGRSSASSASSALSAGSRPTGLPGSSVLAEVPEESRATSSSSPSYTRSSVSTSGASMRTTRSRWALSHALKRPPSNAQ